MQPLISIIIPVFNTEKYLNNCLHSVVYQSYKNLQIICVNDESTDNSQLILDKFKNLDDRIEIINKKNGGLSSARNSGLEHVKGDWIFFLDSDDFILKNSIRDLVSCIKPDTDAVVGNVKVDYEAYSNLKLFDKYYFNVPKTGNFKITDEILLNLPVVAWAKLYKTSIIRTYNLKFPEGLYYEDNFWFWAYFALCKNISLTNKLVYVYLRRENGIMSGTFKKTDNRSRQIINIAHEIFSFYSKNDIFDSHQFRLEKIYFNLLNFGLHNCEKWDKPFFYWQFSNLARDFPSLKKNSEINKIANGDFLFFYGYPNLLKQNLKTFKNFLKDKFF